MSADSKPTVSRRKITTERSVKETHIGEMWCVVGSTWNESTVCLGEKTWFRISCRVVDEGYWQILVIPKDGLTLLQPATLWAPLYLLPWQPLLHLLPGQSLLTPATLPAPPPITAMYIGSPNHKLLLIILLYNSTKHSRLSPKIENRIIWSSTLEIGYSGTPSHNNVC